MNGEEPILDSGLDPFVPSRDEGGVWIHRGLTSQGEVP